MLESSGIIDESSVAKFLEDYYRENPIDNSHRKGLSQRYPGMTKDQVDDTLATIEALEWYAKYDPTDAGPEDPLPKTEQYQYESNEIVAEAEKAIVGDYIIFDDLRTKRKLHRKRRLR